MDEPNKEEATTKKRDVLLPASIVIAGVLVAGSVVWSVGKRAEGPSLTAGPNALSGPRIAAMRAVDDGDHLRGSRDAAVTVVEYSDFECPFCKRFHDTMNGIVSSYGNRVAWVYRHYPIEALHPAKAAKESEAAECVAEISGNAAFWKFADRIFEVTPANNGLDHALLPDIAVYAGVPRDAFNTCLSSGQNTARVAASVSEAETLGINGTPYIVFVSRGDVDEDDFIFLTELNAQFALQYPGQPVPFAVDEKNERIGMSGAFPEEIMRKIIDTLLAA
jgi:protein-disulfide isomerase